MDESGFRLRGWQSTDSQGRYFLETILPGALKPVHVRIEPPGGAPFITQVFFPLSSAGLPELHMDVDAREGYYAAYFSFVLMR
jgi:protocatechuate 3,4-dioxygenase beta subunit